MMYLFSWISWFAKSGPSTTFDRLSKQHCNRFLQRVEMPQSIGFHTLWHGLNGSIVIFSEITIFLAVLERRSNYRDASNVCIALSW
jgi:hypothetical protein